MTFKEKVNKLLAEALLDKPTLFLIDLTITDAFKVIVSLDDDNGVALQDCIDVSRAIEANLDREEQDFSLEVASVGVGSPLKLIRQYKKNVGRTLIVKTVQENLEAELVEANDEFVILSWEAREPKKIGKGKETVQKTLQLPYEDIKEAIVTVTF
ncbi:MAG: ribosome assembly cofactor RimP [Flavobacteriaceae bacterium]|uniref:Ribosome maturation factor RimP n=1 Tax=Flavobacterium kayseriense TaxID=2764714 RepID=A0ABR7J3P4_9FLAO|nr:ribosome assembly cofactor RimP [Flavobacterium kayseriense]MBC5840130.1 ribosome assembly cofactor RimP [Flavobacterium kayseriense]MBC5847200.1 ribosome assembly cofactor RimP [Flavobacterium kayseriense]MBU0941761.1 ribosome assembly cofactor RimP [Bacteroidota bacterium]MBX9887852.1 ribosome assembly cofactor RimP [Flavobacteriaceae bacterium]